MLGSGHPRCPDCGDTTGLRRVRRESGCDAMRGMARRGFVTGAAGAVAGVVGAAAVTGDAVARPARAPALAGPAAGRDVVRRELRGVWVATVANTDWPSKPGLSAAAQRDELAALLDR